MAEEDIIERLYALLQGEGVIAKIDQNIVYQSLSMDPANICGLLLMAGYLKIRKKELQTDGSYLCEISIPNREIALVYKNEILSHLMQVGVITRTTANMIAESLYANDLKKLQKAITEYMDKSVSFYDSGAEEAFDQIDDRRYDMEMRNDGIENIFKLGIAFSGKKARIKTVE